MKQATDAEYDSDTETWSYTSATGLPVTTETEPVGHDTWWRLSHLSFWAHSYHTWGKKVRDAFRKPKPAQAPRDEFEAGKVGTL